MKNTPDTEFRTTYHDHIRNDVLPHIPKTGGQLLDLGGGVGATAFAAKEMGLVDQVGVADLVDNTDSKIDLDFSFQGNLEDASFIDHVISQRGKMDVILALDILEHLVDPWATVKKLHESLKPGGVLVASIPNVRNYRALFPLLFKNQWTYRDAGILDRTHLRFFVRATAMELVSSSGLKVENTVSSAVGGGKIKLFRTMTLGLFNSFTDRQYIVVARNEAS
ncbi:methyltransferase domain-containing protein [Sphingorhabdus sp. Alg239-R122]|uniref:class I SAM-dependent methyltransferase n=1 Tax=Sphingorhabdus sp. Alg239-R122 TaxID=2305989 RepID=UPI0013DA198C|nr:methyltransferase domain-containing protein [Sphingorhabdus sp. Alg239-R122]